MMERDDFEAAQAAFSRFLEVFPGDPSARNNLAVCLHKQALCCRRPAHWWKASEIEPLRLRDLQRRERSTAGGCVDTVSRRKFAEAERQFRILLASNQKNEAAMNNLANMYQDTGKFREAKELYVQALAANPDYAAALNNYGVLLCTAGEFDAGIGQLKASILHKPEYMPAYYNLGKAYFTVGNHAEAVRAWSTFLKHDRSRSAWVLRAEKHSAEALQHLGRTESNTASLM